MGISAKPKPPFELFDPETAAVMGLAFDTAWQVLLVTGSELVSSFRAEETREVLALRIITLAQLGERDVFRVCMTMRLRMSVALPMRSAGTPRGRSGAHRPGNWAARRVDHVGKGGG
jgi:hypothetical protein